MQALAGSSSLLHSRSCQLGRRSTASRPRMTPVLAMHGWHHQQDEHRPHGQHRQQQQDGAGSRRGQTWQGAFGPFAWNVDAERLNQMMQDVEKTMQDAYTANRNFSVTGQRAPWGREARREAVRAAQDAARAAWQLPVDQQEGPGAYRFLVDLPGVPKSQLKVQINKQRELTISGERTQPELAAGWVSMADERRGFGSFSRTLRLPADADVSQVFARQEHGVLLVTVPKNKAAQEDTTTIPIL